MKYYIITYAGQSRPNDKETIIVDDLPLWLREHPNCFLTMCTQIDARYDRQTESELKYMMKHVSDNLR